MPTPFETYITSIEKDLKGGKATEHTYRSALEALMESQARGIAASNDPKHIECGAPDFIVEKGKVPLGYVETKDVGVDLNKIEKSDQMKRYLKALHNLILTDYLEFRWYVNGEKKLNLRVAEVGAKGKLTVQPNADKNITNLFRDFYATETPTVATPKDLASRLAGVTHFIRDRITEALNTGDESIQKALQARYNTFRELLLPALKPEEFADLYAQAMTYGLFAAKLSAPEGDKFSLATAYQYLFGNKFLRRLFSDVSEELDEIEIIRPYLQDIVSLLNRANFASILADFGRRTRTEDPVVHFYETFLAAYDPKLRESRGVYYTPEPVVQFIVRSVDELLKSRFGKAWGLADSSVKVLDPATGTGTFLYYVIQQIHEEVVNNRKQAGQWAAKSKELLNRLFGFELLIAPYVVSHLKLGLLLQTLGSPLAGKDDRLRVFLTNTLEEGVTRAEQLQGLGHYIAEEASDAAHVKKQQDIMVVLGNPPYSKSSSNRGKYIGELMVTYKEAVKKEKNIQPLDDDYIKFIRFAHDRIDKTGYGVVALITNHSYLTGLIHRGMREEILKSFSEIYILNLHGNTYLGETTPEGLPDKNVFDIKQGVAISLFVKNSKAQENPARIHYADIWGTREEKYELLSKSTLDSISWETLEPNNPQYFFSPKNFEFQSEYENYFLVSDIFPVNTSGIKTHRDHLVIDDDLIRLKLRISMLRDQKVLDKSIEDNLNLSSTGSWNLSRAREKLRQDEKWNTRFSQIMYRPFSIRWIYYDDNLVERSRKEVMQNMLKGENLGLVANRSTSVDVTFDHIFATRELIDVRMLPDFGGAPYLFPLYHYTTPEETAGTLFAQTETTRKANLSPEFIKAMEEKLGMKFNSEFRNQNSEFFSPEDVFYYTYAVFHNPTYRTRYAEFLKIDFPRLPLTSNKKLFAKLAEKGKELVELHLLKSAKVEDFITAFPIAGNNKVEKVTYAKNRVWINPAQYFDGVPEDVWEFQVGGYQVCEKWLKDRRERVLSGEEINHYQRVVVSLKETIRLMKEIDKLIVKWPME